MPNSARSHPHPDVAVRDAVRQEKGQTTILFALAVLVIFGMVGFVIDLGKAYYAQRQVQATADAASLAGAAFLPDPTQAVTVAKQYGATGKNAPNFSVTEDVTSKCVKAFPGCTPTNALMVSETAHVSTHFMRIFGINNIDVNVKSLACGPCGTRPADVMIVFDRTLSMCMDFNGNPDNSCAKLENARSGMLVLLKALDPAVDRVGLAVLPPATSPGSICSPPPWDVYDDQSASWVPVGLTANWKKNNQLDPNSPLVKAINCLPASGQTAYADAIDKAQAELAKNGRPDVGHFIVFFTDGAANTGPGYYPKTSPYRKQPCHQGITSAGWAKGANTTVYAIGYTLNARGGAANRCQAYDYQGPDEQPFITAYETLQQIATSSGTFFNQPDPGSLDGIFAQIAARISGPRLIPDDTQ
jgi:hypothetical protein